MDFPRELSAGDGFGATIWNGLIRFVRSLRLIQGPGIKLTRTPNGTVVSATAKPSFKGSSKPDNSCFAISKLEISKGEDSAESGDDIQCSISVEFKNPYVTIGGKMYNTGSDSISGDLPGIIALVIDLSDVAPAFELSIFQTFDEMTEEQKDGSNYIIPLYEFDANGVICDFRNAPECDAGEFAEPTEEEEGNSDE